MGLDLSNAAILDRDTLNRIQSAEDILESVRTYVHGDLGIDDYVKPKAKPRDLSEITDPSVLTSDELALLHAQYTAWAQFYNCQLAEIQAGRDIANLKLDQIRSSKELELFTKKSVTKVEVKTMVKADGNYQRFQIEALRFDAMHTIVEARYSAYDKQAAAISRLITLRGQELEATRRDAGILKRGKKAPAHPAPSSFAFGGKKK